MEIQWLVPLIAAIIYISLLIVIVLNRSWQKQQGLFVAYLSAATLWAFSDFLLRSDFFIDYKLLLFRVVICSSVLWGVQIYYFSRSFLNLSGGGGIWFGYFWLLAFGTLAALGMIPPGIAYDNGTVHPVYNWWIFLYAIPFAILAALGLYSLVKKLRSQPNPEEFNKISYLIGAIVLHAIFGFTGMTPLARGFPISHVGGLLSASILTYAVIKHELVSMRVILRRGFGMAILTAFGGGAYLLILFTVHILLDFELQTGTLIAALLTAIVVVLPLNWLRPTLIGKLDQLFYREKYKHRQELSDFIRHGVKGVFSLQELSERLLPLVTEVLNCEQTHMLLPITGGSAFAVGFSEPRTNTEVSLILTKDNPVITWLGREGRYLSHDSIDILPEFRSIWERERATLRNSGIELLFPLISRGNLIGILGLGNKKSGKYSFEDINLLESIASQVAISLEKEYLQEELRKRQQELTLINRLAAVMTSSLNIQEVFNTFISGLKEIVAVDLAAVALIEADEVRFTAIYSEVNTVHQVGDSILYKGSVTEWVYQHRKSLLEADLTSNMIFPSAKEYLEQGISSIIYLPLVTKDEVIGSLIIASCQPNIYTPTQVDLLERLVSQISTSVANAQLYAGAEQRARIDELTGLFNRRHFDESIKQELERHSRYGSMFTLAFLDLDEFKNYNDIMGHPAGDKLLTQAGHLISRATRNIDIPFRYGGDEFAIIMPHTSTDDAFSASERVRLRIAADMQDNKIAVTASIGLASWPSDGFKIDEIINAADNALYHAKRTGGNRTCIVSQMLPSSSEPLGLIPDAEKDTLNTIYALAATIEARDPYTYGHSRKVREYAVALAEALQLPADRVAVVSHAALLHDIGKIGVVDGILNKAGKLDVHEWELIKTHPQLSRTIVGHITSLTPCLPAIHHHHERWDGSGYPDALKGEAIPLEARILSIADAFDAMTSLRPYRAPMYFKDAVKELKRSAGTHFDPKLVEAFIPIVLTLDFEETTIAQKVGSL